MYKQAAEGKYALEDSIQIINEFKSIVDSSAYSMDLGVDSQENLYERIGQNTTYYELMYEMVTKSSNLATNILIEKVGAENVNSTMRSLGAEDNRVLRGVEDQKAFDAGLNNTTTAYDLMLIMEAIAKGEAVNASASQEMFDILEDQKFNELIPAQLPDDVVVAHKTGSITGVQHDAAIIKLPDGTSYLLVILTKNLKDVEQGKTQISEISKLIYDYVISN
jgi:beta-lactamase class A